MLSQNLWVIRAVYPIICWQESRWHPVMFLGMLCPDMTPETKAVLEVVVCTPGAGVTKCLVICLPEVAQKFAACRKDFSSDVTGDGCNREVAVVSVSDN